MGKDSLKRFAQRLGLPRDMVRDLPYVVMEGNDEMVIDNHKGIAVFTATMMKLRTSQGAITITGEGLRIEGLADGALVLRGQIKSVEYS